MNRTYLLRAAHDSYAVIDLNEFYERDYLCEGGILNILLLESFSPVDKLKLFYALAYVYSIYKATYPEGNMSDDNYLLFTKVEAELSKVVPDVMALLKDTYEAWLVNETMWYGGIGFLNKLLRGGPGDMSSFMVAPPKFGVDRPKSRSYQVWKKSGPKPAPGETFFEDEDWWVNYDDEDYSAVKAFRIYKNRPRYENKPSRSLGQDVPLTEVSVYYSSWNAAPDSIHVVPVANQTPTLPSKYFKDNQSKDNVMRSVGTFEKLYGKITYEDYLNFNLAAQRLDEQSEGATNANTTIKIARIYNEFLRRAGTDWGRNIATISIALNVAHNNGTMAEKVGSKFHTRDDGGVTQEILTKLTNLHTLVPEGATHKALKYVYNNWRSLV